MKWGLVLAGGGVKGSYQIGVYRALCDMGIEIGGIAGTSIGAINGALIVQGGFDKAIEIWNDIKLCDIVDVPEGIDEPANLFDIKNIKSMVQSGKGLDMTPLEELLRKMIDEEKIRESKMDYGLVTYSVTHHTEIALFKEDIPQGELSDYVMASSRIVGFKLKKIGDEEYVDGGVTNNIPVNLLIDRGYNNIIVVDIRGVGITKGHKDFGKNIVLVRPFENVVGTLDFDTDNMMKNVSQGYLDTMRAFGVLEGENYYFDSPGMREARKKYSHNILRGIEAAAELLKIDRYKPYSPDELIKIVMQSYGELESTYIMKDESDANFISKLVKMAQSSEPYFLCELVRIAGSDKFDILNNKLVAGTLGRFAEAAGAVLYFKGEHNVG